MYLLDTNVLSELRRQLRMDACVRAWALSVLPNDLFLSTITLMEVEIGIAMLARRDMSAGAVLRAWFYHRVMTAFADRILAVDAAVALRCARLHVPDRRAERDALIAATALTHGLTVVTRNVRDFAPMGVQLLNPWDWDG